MTEPPGQAPSTLASHANVAWLVKKYAVTTLPSIGSLRALRAFAKGEPGREPFLGFGDPVLQGSGDARRRMVPALYSRGCRRRPTN